MKEDYSRDFCTISYKIEPIVNIMNNYLFEDLMVAVYCINICVNNRSVLESQMTLNLGLKLCNKNGKEEIKTYKQFKEFFNKIKQILGVSYADDPVCEDFGIVKFKFDNEIYNVILGTGFNCCYGQLYFLKPLSVLTSHEEKTKKVLKYNSKIIEFFKDVNINDNKIEIRFVLPNSKLFTRTKKYFDRLNFDELKDIYNIMKTENNYIEVQHFFEYNDKIYPLYNTSILIDLFDLLYSNITKVQKVQLVDMGIINVLCEISKTDQGESPNVYFPINLVDKSILKAPYTFLWRTLNSNNVIIAINKDRFENKDELIEEIKKIKTLLKNNKLEIVEYLKRNPKGYRGVKITNKCNIKFIIHNSFVNLHEINFDLKERRTENILECSAIDLVYMLLFMKNIDELEEYIDYNDNKDYNQMIAFGGDSERFFIWKQMSHMLAKGAITFDFINVDLNTSDEYVINYYKDVINNYPWKNSDNFLMNSPFQWNIEKENDEIFRFENKINPTFFGYVKYLQNNGICFFSHNLLFYKEDSIDEYKNIVYLIDDINMRKLKTCGFFLNEISKTGNNFIQVIFMPNNYSKKVGLSINQERKYVNSDCIISSNCINIRYCVNFDKLSKDIMESDNRSVENEYIKELFMPLNEYFPHIYAKLCTYLDKTKDEKKEVDIIQLAIDYVYNDSNIYFNVDLKYFLQAKKNIAKICLNNEIQPGEYFGKDANKVIRKMQKGLIEFLEDEIKKYNQKDLHIKLLEMYSNCIHVINIHRRRYDSITNVTPEVLKEVRKKIISEREQERRNARTILYMIESNLYLKRSNGEKISKNKLDSLLAFTDWVITLSDNADICYYTENEAHINIDFEYVVENVLDLNEEDDYSKRVYEKNGYTISNDSEDKKFFADVKDSFEQESGVSMNLLLDFCHFLQVEFIKYTFNQLSPNVYEMDEKLVKGKFKELIESVDVEKYSEEQIQRILDFLTIDSNKLKERNGKIDFYLPINERENRNNRFDVKPIISFDNKIIFSPVIIKNVSDLWFNGFVNFMLPYEIGFDKTVDKLLKWKKRYEDKMVDDIEEIFHKNGISFVRKNLDLYKVDKKEKYPIDLGDYDILAIDDKTKKIWLIESKVLNKVGSIFEMYTQQRNFFLEKKYDEKFQRRIDFMNENFRRVLKSFGFIECTGYKVIPYMVFNKVISSRYKKLKFPLISIMELDEIISKEN